MTFKITSFNGCIKEFILVAMVKKTVRNQRWICVQRDYFYPFSLKSSDSFCFLTSPSGREGLSINQFLFKHLRSLFLDRQKDKKRMMKANIYISSNKNCIPEGENEVKLNCKDKCLRWQPNSYQRISVKEFIVLAETEIESKQLVSNENCIRHNIRK